MSIVRHEARSHFGQGLHGILIKVDEDYVHLSYTEWDGLDFEPIPNSCWTDNYEGPRRLKLNLAWQ